MEKLILLGGGGHCKACIDVVEQEGTYEIVGILDREDLVGQEVLGYKIIGTDKDIAKYIALSHSFLLTMGQIKSSRIRKDLFHNLEHREARLATVISPKAYVSRHAQIGRGTIVMHNVFVSAAVSIGENCILNTGCNIEHESIVGGHTHISTYAIVNGNSQIGDQVFIGSNATISNGVTLGNDVVIGAGSVVIRDIEGPGIYAGNPAKSTR